MSRGKNSFKSAKSKKLKNISFKLILFYLLTSKRIYIVGVRGPNERGNIAVDDISFTENSDCGVLPAEVVTELSELTTTLPATTTPQTPASDQFSCNFDEENKCGWLDDLSLPTRWQLSKGPQPPANTGPITDVSKTGFYVYIDGNTGSKARLISPLINESLSDETRIFSYF